jgi:hypothetical protein
MFFEILDWTVYAVMPAMRRRAAIPFGVLKKDLLSPVPLVGRVALCAAAGFAVVAALPSALSTLAEADWARVGFSEGCGDGSSAQTGTTRASPNARVRVRALTLRPRVRVTGSSHQPSRKLVSFLG